MTDDAQGSGRPRVTLRFDLESFGPEDRGLWPAFQAACRDFAVATGLEDEPAEERTARARACLADHGLPADLDAHLLAAFDDFAASGAHAAAKSIGAY
ncbi:hypothetical protein OPKNFCMD_0691 [Methylobacterium crusticola]|uniref:Uncharacterized protein n=1 Tax=Methylobacterium crusticola TaxID=1697972 RepID=A0ABQ4QRN7_9HYPH|nr:hypothetical protein [Methylobacterium crusticola]GJD47978.1 hypothetical protein OPKNFCMD_0691 [Methylobacterium crusticola]